MVAKQNDDREAWDDAVPGSGAKTRYVGKRSDRAAHPAGHNDRTGGDDLNGPMGDMARKQTN